MLKSINTNSIQKLLYSDVFSWRECRQWHRVLSLRRGCVP